MSAVAGPAWDQTRRSEALHAVRGELLQRLPIRVSAAAKLTPDVRELIVDDAIEFTALDYAPSVASSEELTRVFWDAAGKRVHRACEGRYDTIRAGHARADLSALEALETGATPEDVTLARAELRAQLQFAAVLDPDEREVWSCQHRLEVRDGDDASAKRVAHELGLPPKRVRALLRTIEVKRERFAVIYAAGRLCGFLAPGVAALAAGDGEHRLETGARFHLEIDRCPTCRADYTRQLRYLRSARFHGKVGELLPAPATLGTHRRVGVRDLAADWIARVLGHDAPAAVQLATGGAGRGLGTAAMLKLAALCTGSAVGACVATGVLPLPAHHNRPQPKPAVVTASPTATPAEPEPRLPHGVRTPTPTPTPRPAKRRTPTTRNASSTTQGATGARSHEQAPASPAPANAAANGASEFDPTYQPNSAPQPAPVPAAPGASEFG